MTPLKERFAKSTTGSTLRVVLRGRHLLALDALAVAAAFLGSLALRFDAPSPLFAFYVDLFGWLLPILVVVRVGAFVSVGLYQRVWRYASLAEMWSIVSAVAASSLLAYGVLIFASLFFSPLREFPRSIMVVDTLLLTAFIGGMRFSFVLLRFGRRGAAIPGATRALVVGAGASGVALSRQVIQDPATGLRVVGFIDDEEAKGHRLLGIPVLGAIADLGAVIETHGVGTVLFALPTADGPTLRRLVRIAERHGAKTLTVPSLSEVLAGEISSSLREIQVDDLLRRAPAKIDLESVRDSFTGRTILITGAGGSIGGELARQLARFKPRSLVLLGRGENSVYELLESLREVDPSVELRPVILDVRDEVGVPALVRAVRPDAVFHAAAHKHVSFMERFPEQAIGTNVLGTANLLRACEIADVETFVFVSTDKAVRPTSVMGATKRIAELLVRDAARRTGRRYVVVRFGNVLSSRGSVLPRFRRQLANGGPLTVTHPAVRRFFMTVTESVQLILQAAVLGDSGETFVLDMGEPVLIVDLARDLIELHGMVPGKDIQIEYSGLLPGEKLDEELFLPAERTEHTRHASIWTATDTVAHALPTGALQDLAEAVREPSQSSLRQLLQRLVPEYTPAEAPPMAESARRSPSLES